MVVLCAKAECFSGVEKHSPKGQQVEVGSQERQSSGIGVLARKPHAT